MFVTVNAAWWLTVIGSLSGQARDGSGRANVEELRPKGPPGGITVLTREEEERPLSPGESAPT